jgi:ankyrin repeat protein
MSLPLSTIFGPIDSHRNKNQPIRSKETGKRAKMSRDEAFYVACFKGVLTDAKRELENGADINFTCNNGWSALHGAAHAGCR